MKKGKKAKNTDEAWKIQERYKDQPHGWIQWKGTNVCMDVHCKCGAFLHVDDSFVYHIKCLECNTSYFCNGFIELIEVEEEPENCLIELKEDDY